MYAQIHWTDSAGPAPHPRHHRGAHARPGLARRFTRAVLRGTARVIAFPLWPGYITYKKLELTWK